MLTDDELTQVPSGDDDLALTDEVLVELAMAADPERPFDDDAVPFTGATDGFPELLPGWYMPVPTTLVRRRWHRVVVGVVIAAFTVINALGLCITYGYLTVA